MEFHRKKLWQRASFVTLLVSLLSGVMMLPSQAQVPPTPYAPGYNYYGSPGYATPYAPGTYATPSYDPRQYSNPPGYAVPSYDPRQYSNYPGYAAPSYDPRRYSNPPGYAAPYGPRVNQPASPWRTLPERRLPTTTLPTGVPEIRLP